MRATFSLWLLLRRRGASSSDPQRLTTVLAVVAFAVATALLLVVLGGVGAFVERAVGADETSDAPLYVSLAWMAAGLLVVPLSALGGAAARLAVARRDARLAALRLAGATTGQVATLTVLDAASQALLGALTGILGYLALIPVFAHVRFQGRAFGLGELWTGVPVLLAAVTGVVLVALFSSVVSLRRVAITPLGVANRVHPKGLSWSRVVLALAIAAVFGAITASGDAATLVIGAVLVLGFFTLNLVGPFTIWLIGRVTAARARKVPTLLAGRRMVDDPKTAWRSVGGVALATFIAGMTSIGVLMADADSSPENRQFLTDIATGGYLTLAIAGLLAAVSTGVMQAGQVIGQRSQYRALSLAGTDLAVLNAARMKETVIPLVVSVGTTALFSLLFMVPLFRFLGLSPWDSAHVPLQYAASVLAAGALVLAGSAASRSVVRDVVAG